MQRRQLTSIVLGSLLVGVLVLPMTAQAQSGIDRRQAEQRHRIQQGLADGSLTPREADRLRWEQRRIRQQEREFWADGRLDRQERRILHRELAASSDHIDHMRHNRRYR
jgi:hypothetical protein